MRLIDLYFANLQVVVTVRYCNSERVKRKSRQLRALIPQFIVVIRPPSHRSPVGIYRHPDFPRHLRRRCPAIIATLRSMVVRSIVRAIVKGYCPTRCALNFFFSRMIIDVKMLRFLITVTRPFPRPLPNFHPRIPQYKADTVIGIPNFLRTVITQSSTTLTLSSYA